MKLLNKEDFYRSKEKQKEYAMKMGENLLDPQICGKLNGLLQRLITIAKRNPTASPSPNPSPSPHPSPNLEGAIAEVENLILDALKVPLPFDLSAVGKATLEGYKDTLVHCAWFPHYATTGCMAGSLFGDYCCKIEQIGIDALKTQPLTEKKLSIFIDMIWYCQRFVKDSKKKQKAVEEKATIKAVEPSEDCEDEVTISPEISKFLLAIQLVSLQIAGCSLKVIRFSSAAVKEAMDLIEVESIETPVNRWRSDDSDLSYVFSDDCSIFWTKHPSAFFYQFKQLSIGFHSKRVRWKVQSPRFSRVGPFTERFVQGDLYFGQVFLWGSFGYYWCVW